MTSDWADVGDAVVRAFIAVDLSPAVKDALVNYISRLQRVGAHVSWTARENLHITLAFLGDMGAAAIRAAVNILDELCRDQAAFDLDCMGVGTFGSPYAPRVIWAGIEDRDHCLGRFQARLADRLKNAGLRLDDRPFHAHVTLGRVRSQRGVRDLTSILRSDKRTQFGGFRVERALLMRSHLDPRGAIYTVLHASPMKGAENS